MARRIGLAQALINDPDLLILDEPTTGLDPIGTRQIKDLILKLAERGKTILLSSHLLADVEDVCDRIAILYGGKVQAQGRVTDLLQQTDKQQIVTNALSEKTLGEIRDILQREKAECEVVSPMEKLEAFFIRTVVEAQRQARPTSGAVSTTQIGDFLAGQEAKESILDKLVSAPTVEEKPAPAAQTEEPARPPTAKPEPDRRLLSELTKAAPAAQTEQVTPGSTSEPQRVEKEEPVPDSPQVKKNILDELTERPAEESHMQPEDAGEPPEDGESGHA
jgi:ABC-2 type transport system ATP-binding protein